MRTAVIIVVSLIGAVAAMWAIGAFLPVAHVASGTATFDRPAEEVYRLIASVENYPRWWDEVSGVEILARDEAGRLTFRQHAADGPIVMQVVEQQPPARFVTRIADPDQPFGGTWTFDLAAEGPRTRLTITERGEVYNPLFRFLSRFVFGHAGTIESFLDAARGALSTPLARTRAPNRVFG
jgi:uncharacterized protein YndB with AHSA1/START domain